MTYSNINLKNAINFFDFKADVEQLLQLFGVNAVWEHVDQAPYPWFHPYMTAKIVHQDRIIGYAGVSNPIFIKKIIDGSFFIFEINAAHLFAASDEHAYSFEPLSKYPATWFDISLFIPLAITVAQLKNTISKADGRIFKVALIDFYENKEWTDKRSVTLRFWARDNSKTLTHEDIDHLYDHVKIAVKQLGVTLR